MIAIGATAPHFCLPDADGETVSLTELIHQGPLILFFYPADFTPVCTKEVCLFQDVYAELAGRGIGVAGISPDNVESHARFRDQHRVSYRLLADADKQTCKAYGVVGLFGLLRRTTYLIGRDGRINAAARADLRLSPHDRLIQQALAAG